MVETLKRTLIGWCLAVVCLAACRGEEVQAVLAGSEAPASGSEQSAAAPLVTTTSPLTPAAPNTVGPNAAELAARGSELSAVLTDEQIAKIVDELNAAEIEQARLVLGKSQNEPLKSFAQMMIDHHGEARRELDALRTQKTDSALAQKLLQESQVSLSALQRANGVDVDRAYATGQVDAHQKALTTLQQRLLPSTKGTALKSYLRQLEQRLEQHLGRARSLSASFGRASG